MKIEVAVKTVEVIDLDPVIHALDANGFAIVECNKERFAALVNMLMERYTVTTASSGDPLGAGLSKGCHLIVTRPLPVSKASKKPGRKSGGGRPAGPTKLYEATRKNGDSVEVHTGSLTDLAKVLNVSRMALYLAVTKKNGEAKGLGITLKETTDSL